MKLLYDLTIAHTSTLIIEGSNCDDFPPPKPWPPHLDKECSANWQVAHLEKLVVKLRVLGVALVRSPAAAFSKTQTNKLVMFLF
jgi:hypothetical protein